MHHRGRTLTHLAESRQMRKTFRDSYRAKFCQPPAKCHAATRQQREGQPPRARWARCPRHSRRALALGSYDYPLRRFFIFADPKNEHMSCWPPRELLRASSSPSHHNKSNERKLKARTRPSRRRGLTDNKKSLSLAVGYNADNRFQTTWGYA